ncbi:lung adenoma susceptibility protein 2 isoform X1 [Amphiprion ocellaris]|uniref:Lung adenoma susceptibility protein 2 n=2 Tax=Amphiprion ocellaris TaxID=80972 RepID=A0AAQ6A7E8_AMPOC|nr:lung adenoma susceptibility protein 2 isoform X1 [Amphiprion ocellaris]
MERTFSFTHIKSSTFLFLFDLVISFWCFYSMESTVGDFLSPESTVTSLLSSSGHLRSSLRPPEHSDTFRYRDKDYDSASAALDAYIADFDRSRQNSEASTGKLVLQQNRPSTPSRPRLLRNKDVLRERLTDQELDFLNLPVSSLRHRSNRDRLSMTTDELLAIPNDGSMPITHTSAFIQGLLSRSESSQHRPSSRPACRTCSGLSSSHTVLHHQNQNHQSLPPRTSRSCRCKSRPGAAMFKPGVDVSSAASLKSAHRAVRSEWAGPSSSFHLPHWLTSNKADMNCSGISSVPDFNYPAWIQSCDLSEPPPSTDLWDFNAPRAGVPSWVEDLEKDDDPDNTSAQVDNQQTLRDLRLQLAEQISVIAADRKDSMTALFRDNRIESLIQKADQVLNSLSQNCGGAESPPEPVISSALSPVNTEDLLLCSPSLRPPVAPDSAAGGATESLTEKTVKFQDYDSHKASIWKQPGPVEALKQMLFRLQSVESELQRQQEASPELQNRLQTPEKQFPDGESELQNFPGRPSLQRALHHLNRLKLLVEEPTKKHREEEKDEDEGRYSSSSADGLMTSQKEPS